MLTRDLNLSETLRLARTLETRPTSRLRIGSPCKFIRSMDVLVHLVAPEVIEDVMPRAADYLRRTSPSWGKSWRSW
jgi:hypothetical protein